MYTLIQLKALNLDKLDIEDAVAALVSAEALVAGFGRVSLPTPEWLEDKVSGLRNEVASRRRDDLARKLKNLKAESEADRTPDQRRAARAAEIARLEQMLTST